MDNEKWRFYSITVKIESIMTAEEKEEEERDRKTIFSYYMYKNGGESTNENQALNILSSVRKEHEFAFDEFLV